MRKETITRKKVLAILKSKGYHIFPLSDRWMSGYPDILAVKPLGIKQYLPGEVIVSAPKYIWVEIKSEKGKLRRIQEVTIDNLRKLGCLVYVISNKEQAEAI